MDQPASHGSQLAAKSPPQRPLRERIPLQGRKVLKKSIRRVISVLVCGAILSYALPWSRDLLLQHYPNAQATVFVQHYRTIVRIMAVLIGLLLLSAPIYQSLHFWTYFYDVNDNSVVIRKGVIAKREATLPFKSITDVYVDQDMFDVVLGLYDLHISTPTPGSGAFSHIDGLDKIGAAALKQLILDSVQKDG